MLSTPISSQTVNSGVLTTPATSNAWQVGTVLKALVLSPTTDGATRLQIGARVVTAQTALTLQKGDALRLEVVQAGRTVVLKAQTRSPVADQINHATRQALPRQSAQAPLIASTLAAVDPQRTLPPALRQALQTFTQAVQVSASLTNATQLKAAVRDSGIFLESRLAAMATNPAGKSQPPSGDWKLALLQLRAQLAQSSGSSAAGAKPAIPGSSAAALQTLSAPLPASTPASTTGVASTISDVAVAATANVSKTAAGAPPAPPQRHGTPQAQAVVETAGAPTQLRTLVAQLVEQTEGALARVQLNQLASATQAGDNKVVWLLELPVRHADNTAEAIALRIEREAPKSAQDSDATWTAQLAFDLGSYGTLSARIALRGQRIYTSFQAEQPQARESVNERLELLRASMQAQELDVACLNCSGEHPAQPVASDATLLRETA